MFNHHPGDDGLAASPQAENRKSVLLVEDDSSTRWLVRNALKNECEFLTAGDGAQAVDIYRRCMPEVVFLDFHLPDRKGSEVLRMILDCDPGAFVVVLSGAENISVMMEMIASGAKGLLIKPFGSAELLRYVRNSPLMR